MTPPSSTPDPQMRHRPAGQQDSRRIVAQRLQARKRRASLIRRRTVAIVATVFVFAWSVIFIQLASGHDPALSRKAAVASPTTGGSTSGSGSADAGGLSSGTSDGSSSGATVPAPITTSQS